MKRLSAIILMILSLLASAAAASELVKISKTDRQDSVQVYFSFDKTPEFTSTRNERRIDLEFFDTSSAPALSIIPPDDNIVKILPRPGKDRYALSLFFRYRPQRYTLTKSSDGNVVLEVLLGNEYSKSYQSLADKLKGLTLLERNASESSNPQLISPYTRDWMSFFSQYESSLAIHAPVKFHSPPFPIISLLPPGYKDNIRLLTPEMLELANQNLWDNLSEELLLTIKNTQDIESKKILALAYGEVLSKSGNFEDGYKQLYLLKEQYSDELLGTYAGYLLNHLVAVNGDAYSAESGFEELETTISPALPLAPYFLLSQIEASLATGNYPKLNHLLLTDNIALPEQIAALIQIRQADYWYAIDQQIKAKAAYQLLSDSALLKTLPYSLSSSCNINYDHKKFEEAETCYTTLASLVSDKELIGLINYKKNMAKLRSGDKTSLIDAFSHIENAFPRTEAGYRAAIKRNDLLFLESKSWGQEVLANYSKIARDANRRPIREEAVFKHALVNAILGETPIAIQLLQNFLREFLIGDVRISAQALLIQLLPKEIKRLVDEKDYIHALVLAKKNKEFFENNWIDGKLLIDIADAYNQIGVYDEAQRLYLYLITVLPVNQREDLYLPMIKATFAHGSFSLVDDYAAQYFYNYPNGRFRNQILFLRLQSLVASDRLSEALRLLPDPLPNKKEVYELAVSLYFRLDNFSKCIGTAHKLAQMKSTLSPREQFMLAESLYQTGNSLESEQEFGAITEENDFYEQSLYRLAEFARQRGEEKKALSLFTKIVEREKNSLWKQYAERELQFAKISNRF